MSQATRINSVTEEFERAVTAATAPLRERMAAQEQRITQLEKDLLALRRGIGAKVFS